MQIQVAQALPLPYAPLPGEVPGERKERDLAYVGRLHWEPIYGFIDRKELRFRSIDIRYDNIEIVPFVKVGG